MDDLTNLARKYGTDKCGSHHYTQVYERFFRSFRERPIRLLEIGIGGYDDLNAGGESLRMWRDYFPNGLIFGVDIYPKALEEHRIKTIHGNQADPVSVAHILTSAGGRFDIIIDDGSHQSEHVIATFIMLFQHLEPGGIYAIEDTQTSYWARCAGNSYDLNSGKTTMSYFKNLVDGLNWEEIHNPGYSPSYNDRNIVGIHFFHNLIFVEKGDNKEGSNHVVANRVPGQ